VFYSDYGAFAAPKSSMCAKVESHNKNTRELNLRLEGVRFILFQRKMEVIIRKGIRKMPDHTGGL
jgi:hypothetical protein